METKKLNLNKIKLYCLLNNVQDTWGVPACFNCFYWKRETFKGIPTCKLSTALKFCYDKHFKKFELEHKENEDWQKDYGCGKWKIKKES